MAKKKEVDIEKEIERLSRKTNYNMRKSEYSFDKQIKRLDSEIDKVMNDKVKQFEDNKKATQDYLSLNYKQDTIDRYREKLKKI